MMRPAALLRSSLARAGSRLHARPRSSLLSSLSFQCRSFSDTGRSPMSAADVGEFNDGGLGANLTAGSVDDDSVSDTAKRYNRRPMRTFFREYDRKFDSRLEELEVAKRDALKNWDIVASAFLERPQVVFEEPDDTEKEYVAIKELIDEKYMVDLSEKIAGHEDYQETHSEAMELIKEMQDAEDEFMAQAKKDNKQGEQLERERAQFREDFILAIRTRYAGSELGERIVEEFRLHSIEDQPRQTKADKEGNRRSLNRQLDQRLFLIVKKDRSEFAWQFPQMVHVDADPDDHRSVNHVPGLRETAEEAMKIAGRTLQGYFYSHAPQGFYYYPYTAEDQKGDSFGAKVFYYRVRYLKGAIDLGPDVVDYAWVTRDELSEYFDEETFTFVRQMV